MLGLLIVSLCEIKSYVVILFFYIKMMKRRTLQACRSKHNINKKTCFLFRENWTYISWARGSPPPTIPSPSLGYTPAAVKCSQLFLQNILDVSPGFKYLSDDPEDFSSILNWGFYFELFNHFYNLVSIFGKYLEQKFSC